MEDLIDDIKPVFSRSILQLPWLSVNAKNCKCFLTILEFRYKVLYFVNWSFFRRFFALDCLFFQRLITLKLPNSPFQVSDRSISTLHSPEKTTSSHDVAPEET